MLHNNMRENVKIPTHVQEPLYQRGCVGGAALSHVHKLVLHSPAHQRVQTCTRIKCAVLDKHITMLYQQLKRKLRRGYYYPQNS